MAGIYKRKSKYNVIYYEIQEDGRKKQRWKVCSTLEEAKRLKEMIEYQQKYGCKPLPQIYIVKDLLTVFVEDYGTSHWSMSTYEHKKGLLENYIIPTIGNVPIS